MVVNNTANCVNSFAARQRQFNVVPTSQKCSMACAFMNIIFMDMREVILCAVKDLPDFGGALNMAVGWRAHYSLVNLPESEVRRPGNCHKLLPHRLHFDESDRKIIIIPKFCSGKSKFFRSLVND